RGLGYGGLARAISIAERFARTSDRRRPITIRHETPVSAQIDGGDNLGYIVAHRATEIAVEKASAAGIAVVGANDTWYTGMLSYYAEIAAARGLVSMIASNASPWVAPHGATEGRFGTNPICFGFPSADEPVIWDVGTSAIIHAEAALAKRLGQPLPENVAFDRDGSPTRDPAAALAGAFAAWGGHKGSGLGIVVQLLGIMAGRRRFHLISPVSVSSSWRCARISWDRQRRSARTCRPMQRPCEPHGRSQGVKRCGCRSIARGAIASAGLPKIALTCPTCCSSS